MRSFTGGTLSTSIGLSPGDDEQGLQDGRVAASPRDQGPADRRQDMGAVGQHLARLGKIAAAQIFEHDRQIIGQFARGELEPRPLVELLELDHGLAAVAAFAVQMLEQMQRERAATVEQIDVALLGRQQVAVAEFVDQMRRDRRGGADRAAAPS